MEEEFNPESLVVFKLMNGEIIACEIVAEDEQQVTVRYAIRAIEMFSSEEEEIRFAPWIPFTEDVIIIYRQGILAVAPPSEYMKEMYLNKLEAKEENSKDEVSPGFRRQCQNHSFIRQK
jgi:hypothetical protein